MQELSKLKTAPKPDPRREGPPRRPEDRKIFRSSVVVVDCGDPAGAQERTMERTMAALSEIGEYPPLPTALFPCDASTTEMAVFDLVWRLQLCAQLLDDVDSDDAERVQRKVREVFLARGLVITRPDTVTDAASQNKLLDALELYSAAAHRFG